MRPEKVVLVVIVVTSPSLNLNVDKVDSKFTFNNAEKSSDFYKEWNCNYTYY